MILIKNQFELSHNKFCFSLLVLSAMFISGCGTGGGSAESKTGTLSPSSIAITPTSSTVAKGQVAYFTATATYTDGSTVDITNKATWSSANNAVGSIDSTSGAATGVAVGSTTITATLQGITSPAASMSITTATITAINISATNQSIPKGAPNVYKALATFSDNTTGDVSGSVTWLSDNPAVATVSNTGVATGLNAGQSDISANSGNVTSKIITMTVTPSRLMGGAVQGTTLNLTSSVTTFAGSGSVGGVNGIGTLASFNWPASMTTDGNNLYVADASNNKIRKIVIATGEVSTFAGSGVSGSADGSALTATFSVPQGVTTDGSNLYVADTGNRKIRKVEIASGVVTTLAGSGELGAVDGAGLASSFYSPKGITTDGINLYIADFGANKIRKIEISTRLVTTFIGSGDYNYVEGVGAAASIAYPEGITTDGINLFLTGNDHKIYKIEIATAAMTKFAGSGAASAIDGTGQAASFYMPRGIVTDGSNLFVADRGNQKIRKVIIASKLVTTLAGSGSAGSLDGNGTSATFNAPIGIANDGTSLYVSEDGGNVIRKIR